MTAAVVLDQRRLMAAGLEHVRVLSQRIWTDYNVHDPAVTALELASYALTDLGERAEWPIEDLLASSTPEGAGQAPFLFSARTILPNRALTQLDYRKLLIDLDGVKNAWIRPALLSYYLDPETGELFHDPPPIPDPRVIPIEGLFNVLIEFMDDVAAADQAAVLDQASARLAEQRNLCEDFVSVEGVEQQLFRLCGELELAPDADPVEVKAEILFQTERYLAPPVWNYTLSQMLERHRPDGTLYTAPEIFEGPALASGFYDDAELENADLRTEIRLSDLIGIIMDIPGVRAVRDLLVSPADSNEPVVEKWVLPVTPGRQPMLASDQSRLVFFKRRLPIVPADGPVQAAYQRRVSAERTRLTGQHEDDIPIPQGRDRRPWNYYSFQNHFPAVYGIGEQRLSFAGLSDEERDIRQAQILQLEGYLLFLDQVMANYCAQLSRVSDLFAADPELRKSYFTQPVALLDAGQLYEPAPPSWQKSYEPLLETPVEGAVRRNQLLDHLIARFAERFHDYASIMYSIFGVDRASLIRPKCEFLKDYPGLSRDRAGAWNYADPDPLSRWDTENVSGFERRVARLLDLGNDRRRDLSDVVEDAFAVVEADAGVFRFQIIDREHPEDTLLQGRTTVATAAEARDSLRRALRFAQWRQYYQPLIAADGRPYFNLVDDTGAVLATRYFDSEAARDSAIGYVLQNISHWYAEEGMYLIENILLRPPAQLGPFLNACVDPDCTDCPGDDPYSYRLHIVLPAYAGRFATMEFRRFVEEVLREELPAHLLAKICWISREDMGRLEVVYRKWIDAQAEGSDDDRSAALKALIAVLVESKNVYPPGRLRACQRGEDTGRFQLGRSALGTADLQPD